MKSYVVYFTTIGSGYGIIHAETLREAQEKAAQFDFEGEQSDWDYENISSVEEQENQE